MRYVMIFLLILFAYSATLKHFDTKFHYTDNARRNNVYSWRHALPVFEAVNHAYPDAKLFHHYFDEYRLWIDVDCIGRRTWKDSIGKFLIDNPENTPSQLYAWLVERDRTHVFVNPYAADGYELPTDHPEWSNYFHPAIVYGYYTMWSMYDMERTIYVELQITQEQL